jgi:hypothetical protein
VRDRLLSVGASAFLLCASLAAADFTGTWVGQIPGRNDTFVDVAFKFVQNGTKLSGKVYGDYRSTPISEAIVAGDLITFVVVTQEQAGNQINETRVRFTGKMIDGEIELTREREAATNAGNSGSVYLRNNTKQTFRLKRLL